jgi:hypothetical protein
MIDPKAIWQRRVAGDDEALEPALLGDCGVL